MPCVYHPTVEQGLVRCSRCARSFCPDCLVHIRGLPSCAACKSEHVRDLQSGTAPGALELASIGRRFGALWIDGMLTGAVSMAILIPVIGLAAAGQAYTGSEDAGAAAVLLVYPVLIALPFVYDAVMVQMRGQTLGKMAVGIKVVTPSGEDVSPGQAWGRAGARTVLNFCVAIDYLPALGTRERTCIHDMLARTRVIRLPR
jgi:uncharacterized RDD family membrane protein YckC